MMVASQHHSTSKLKHTVHSTFSSLLPDTMVNTKHKAAHRIEGDMPVLVRQRWPEKRQKIAHHGQHTNPTSSLKKFCRRLLRLKSNSSESNSNLGKFHKKNKKNRVGSEDEKSLTSVICLSSEGSSDSSQSFPTSDHTVEKNRRTITSFISDDTSPTFFRRNIKNRDDKEVEIDWGEDTCRDDIFLLQQLSCFNSHPNYHEGCSGRETREEEDCVALLSEYDDLVDIRKGSYDIDIVDPFTINTPAALQTLPLLALIQDLASQEGDLIKSLMKQLCKSWSSDDQVSSKFSRHDVELNVEEGKSEPTNIPVSSRSRNEQETQIEPENQTSGNSKDIDASMDNLDLSFFDLLGEDTTAFLEIIRDRTQRHKAVYLSKLQDAQKKNKGLSHLRPAVHGILFPLTELPSDDERSRYSGNFTSPVRLACSGSGDKGSGWSTEFRDSRVIPEEEEEALVSASF
jgi:hypothetical protein